MDRVGFSRPRSLLLGSGCVIAAQGRFPRGSLSECGAFGEVAEDFVDGGSGDAGFEFFGGLVDEDFALVDDDDAVADGFDFFEDVGGEDDGFVCGHGLYQLSHFVLLVGVEAVGGLVEDEHLGVVDDGLGDTDALAVAFGEIFDGSVFNGVEVAFYDDVGEAVVDLVFVGDASGFGDVGKKFDDSHFWIRSAAFGEVANAFFDFDGVFGDVEAVDGGSASGRGEEAGDHLHGGGLASSVGAEKAEDVAFVDCE